MAIRRPTTWKESGLKGVGANKHRQGELGGSNVRIPNTQLFLANADILDIESQTETQKSDAEIQTEIQSLFRQITASVTFLPLLDGNCTFNVLVYADADSEVPVEWGDSDAKEIKNGEKVQLRTFSTTNHRVDTVVSYRLAD